MLCGDLGSRWNRGQLQNAAKVRRTVTPTERTKERAKEKKAEEEEEEEEEERRNSRCITRTALATR